MGQGLVRGLDVPVNEHRQPQPGVEAPATRQGEREVPRPQQVEEVGSLFPKGLPQLGPGVR